METTYTGDKAFVTGFKRNCGHYHIIVMIFPTQLITYVGTPEVTHKNLALVTLVLLLLTGTKFSE